MRKPVPDRAVKTLAELTDHGFKPTKQINDALANYRLVESRRPIKPTDQEVVDTFLNPDATDEDRNTALVLSANHINAFTFWHAARDEAGNRMQAALRDNIDRIVEALRPQAEKAIADIEWFVAEGLPTLPDLLAKGRQDDATRAAGVEVAWGMFDRLTDLRDRALGVRKFTWSIWADPVLVDELTIPNLDTMPPFERICTIITAGGRLAWTTHHEAAEISANRAAVEREKQLAAARELSRQKQSAL